MKPSLAGKVALVAGATRGAGRGIAVQLGAAGATVYVPGRSTRSSRSEMNRPETFEETAALVDEAGGLVVEVTDGTDEYNAANYRVSFFYDLAKASVNRMAFALAHELRPYGATAVSLTPGWLRSEAMLEAYGVTEANWRDATKRSPHFAFSESPAFV